MKVFPGICHRITLITRIGQVLNMANPLNSMIISTAYDVVPNIFGICMIIGKAFENTDSD